MYTNISVSRFLFVTKCKDIPTKFDHDKLAAAALADMAESDDKAKSPSSEAPGDGENDAAANDPTEDAATEGDATAEAGAEDEETAEWPAATGKTIVVEVSDDGQTSLMPKAKTRPASIGPSAEQVPKPKKVKVMEPKEPATPPSTSKEDDTREHTVSDFMCERLAKDFKCDAMSILH